MHYHVTRTDYDTRNGKESEPVLIGIAPDFPSRNAIIDEDTKQWRLPSSPRWILHDYSSRFCQKTDCS